MQIAEELVFNNWPLIALMRLYDAPVYHAKRARAAQLALLASSAPMSREEIIVKFETTMDKVRSMHAARDAELVSAETREAALEPALGDAELGVSKESQNRVIG